MSTLSLSDIEQKRNKLLSRQVRNYDFLVSPEVPFPFREKTLEELTDWKKKLLQGH